MEDSKNDEFAIPVDDEPQSPNSNHEKPPAQITKNRRQATLYDAVAGNVSYQQGIQGDVQAPPRDAKAIRYSTKETPLAPDEVLFRRQHAPERYLEHDIYYANERDLPRGGQGILPESDLLKAVHSYASAFYGAKNRRGQARVAERSMDETALLAFGILLEEAGKEVLGRRGHLVFTEGVEDAPGSDDDGGGGDEAARDGAPVIGHDHVAIRRGPKRRKVADADDE